MADITFEFDSREAQLFFSNINKRSKDIKEKTKAYADGIASFVVGDVLRHFEKESGPDGKWKPWSKLYAEHMQRIGKGGNQILQLTSNLKNAIKPTHYRRSGDGIYWYNDAKTKGGYPYAWGHDTGDGRLPKRSFMWLSDRAMETVSQFTLAFLVGEK